jgi:hypothetical protein
MTDRMTIVWPKEGGGEYVADLNRNGVVALQHLIYLYGMGFDDAVKSVVSVVPQCCLYERKEGGVK